MFPPLVAAVQSALPGTIWRELGASGWAVRETATINIRKVRQRLCVRLFCLPPRLPFGTGYELLPSV